jgi:hypothetical protein
MRLSSDRLSADDPEPKACAALLKFCSEDLGADPNTMLGFMGFMADYCREHDKVPDPYFDGASMAYSRGSMMRVLGCWRRSRERRRHCKVAMYCGVTD